MGETTCLGIVVFNAFGTILHVIEFQCLVLKQKYNKTCKIVMTYKCVRVCVCAFVRLCLHQLRG